MPGKGRPFPPKTSGNPKGRPKQTVNGRAVATIFKDCGPAVAVEISEAALDPRHPDWFDAAKLVMTYHPPIQSEDEPVPLPDGVNPAESITVVRKVKEKTHANG